jgi:hypothetical protein
LYDCATCKDAPYLYEKLGHDGPPTDYFDANLFTGKPLDRCPLRAMQLIEARDPQLVAEFRRMQDWYEFFQRGVLLEPGSLSDQPARYVAWMLAIARVRETIRKMEQHSEAIARAQQAAFAARDRAHPMS